MASEIHAKTTIRVQPRQGEADFVAFEAAGYSSSPVGRKGGRQVVRLSPDTTIGTATHELCHTIGLWHEQSRADRDQFIRVAWENVIPGYEHNFRQRITDGDDIGPYDYESIMHYPADAFSATGQPTIVPLLGSPAIGQRRGLSPFDAQAIDAMYRSVDAVAPPSDTPSLPDGPLVEPVDNSSGTAPAAVGATASKQFDVDVEAFSTAHVRTSGWDPARVVVWTVIPTSPRGLAGPQVRWDVSVGLGGDGLLNYYFAISNLTNAPLRAAAWYRLA